MYIIKYNAKGKLNWDLMIIALAIFNSLLIPINVSFNPDFTNTFIYKLINSGIINIIYFLDILINFMTSVLHIKTGQEIVEFKKIAQLYFFSIRFWFDFISSIPWDLIGGPDFLGLLGLLKISRLARISAFIDKTDIKKESKLVSP